MPIRVICRRCDKQFSAWDDLAGQAVQCPKCQTKMVIPAAAKEAAAGGAKVTLGSSMPADSSAESSADASRKSPSAQATLAPPHPPFEEAAAPPGQRKPQNPPAAPNSAPAVELANTASKSTKRPLNRPPAAGQSAADNSLSTCPHCDQPLPANEDLCNACGYHKILKKVLNMEGIDQADRSTGFERLLKRQLNEGESVQGALVWTKIAAVLGVMILLGFIGICMGPLAAVISLVLVVAFAVWVVQQKKKGCHDSAVNQDFFSTAVWTAFLSLQRAFGWRSLEWPFPQTKVLTMHGPGFSDHDLAEMQNLQSYQTLDLERTEISDAGLVHLAELEGLRYLVLRQTRVTSKGVQRLQARLDQTMIWY